MSDRDYYEILGLTPRADGAMVDQAYWHLARKYQAMAVSNARAQHMLDELNEAYGVLGNPDLRMQYDAFRDDVLVRRGMIRPVKARPEPERQLPPAQPAEARERTWRLTVVRVEHWQTYATSAAIVALALAGAAAGVNFVFVALALAGGLAFSLVPTARRAVSQIDISMPELPSIQLPNVSAPRLSMPEMPDFGTRSLREFGVGSSSKDENVDPDTLRASTAATIARWRASVGLRQSLADAAAGDETPDSTLVDIVEAEREIAEHDEPLTAVMEILRGAHRQTPMR